jgi:hypothetical protein
MKRVLVLILIFSAFTISCDKSETINEPTREYNKRESGSLFLNNPKVIVIENQTGPVIIEGSADSNRIEWFLDKHVFEVSNNSANEIFEKILVSQIQSADTAFITVEIPPAANSANTSLSLTMPSNLPCVFQNIQGEIIINYLQFRYSMQSFSEHISIGRHEGNCSIEGRGENVEVELSLPESGYCFVNLNDGNINLRIPLAEDAMLLAQTNDGAILSSGISISDSVEIPNSLSGKLGNGSGQINLTTGKGNISIEGF